MTAKQRTSSTFSSPIRRAVALGLLVVGFALSACDTTDLSKPTTGFRDGVVKAAEGVPNAMSLANDSHRRMILHRYYAEKLDLAASGAAMTVTNPYAQPIVGLEPLRVRKLALDGIKAYAEQLVSLSSGDATAELDKSAASLGTALQGVDWKDWGLGGGPSPEILAAGTTVIHAFGKFLVDRKLRRELPKIVGAADPHIQSIVALLDNDLEYVAGVVDRNMRQSGQAWDRVLNRLTPTLSPDDARVELGKLMQHVEDRNNWLVTIATARATVAAMGQSHKQLLAAITQKTDHTSLAAILRFIEEGQKLKDFYDASKKSFEPKGAGS